MNTEMIYLAYIVTGAFAGLSSGLFGIGGGFVMVPALLICFAFAGVPVDSIPALTLGTSLAAIFFATTIAAREHIKLGNLKEPFSGRMIGFFLAMGLGVYLGSLVSTQLPTNVILTAIGLFQLGVAIHLFRGTMPSKVVPEVVETGEAAQNRLKTWPARAYLTLTGMVAAIGGVGGATMMVPYFMSYKMDIRKASALSTLFGCVVGLFGFISYGLLVSPKEALPHSIGFVNIPALISLAAGIMLLAKFGARLSMRMSKVNLTRGFCAFLLVCSAKTLWPVVSVALVGSGRAAVAATAPSVPLSGAIAPESGTMTKEVPPSKTSFYKIDLGAKDKPSEAASSANGTASYKLPLNAKNSSPEKAPATASVKKSEDTTVKKN